MSTVLVWARRGAVRARLEAIVASAAGLCLAPRRPGLALDEALDLARPDVALVDLEDEPAASALDALRGRTGAALVVLADAPSRFLDEERAGRGRIRGVLPRDAGAAEIGAAIAAVLAGLFVHHPDTPSGRERDQREVTRALAARVASRRAGALPGGAAEPGVPLTAREIEVLAMVADGLGNKAIAVSLGISAHTAKFHVASILAKLGAASRAEAVAIGLRRGLVVI